MSKLLVDEIRSADRSVSSSANMTFADDGSTTVNGALTASGGIANAGTITAGTIGAGVSTSRLVGISFFNGNNDGNQVTLENNKTYDCVAISLGTAGGSGSEDVIYAVMTVNGSGSVTQTDKVTGSGFRWLTGTNFVYLDEYQSYQGPHWGLVFERGAVFDNS